MPTPVIRLIQLRPGSVSGFDEIFSASLPQATIEPVKVTAPMNTPIQISARWNPTDSIWCPASSSWRVSMKTFSPMSTAARPTKECSWAISCGMPVISTRVALNNPMTAPMSIATISRTSGTTPPLPTKLGI